MLMREKAVAATEPYDFLITPTSPITAYAAEEAAPGNDPLKPFEHIGFTVPFNMSEQRPLRSVRVMTRMECRSDCRSSGIASTMSACSEWRAPMRRCGRRSGHGRRRE